jgi:hypothetical protein
MQSVRWIRAADRHCGSARRRTGTADLPGIEYSTCRPYREERAISDSKPLTPVELEILTPVELETRRWLERAVIGLNLCPFAAAVYAAGQVAFRISVAASAGAWLEEFRAAADWLAAADPRRCETLLLVHPLLLGDFLEFNEFCGECEDALAGRGLEGVLQVASFHPHFRFAGTAAADLGNYTNRAPYPTLHLLRERSVERAVAAAGDPARIYERNIETMNELGLAGWRRLWL